MDYLTFICIHCHYVTYLFNNAHTIFSLILLLLSYWQESV